MVDEPRALDWAAIVDGLFESIEDEACMRCLARPPADNPARVSVYNKSHIDEPSPGSDVGEPKVREAKSLTQSMFGAGTRNWRFTLSCGHGAFLSGMVVLCGLPRMMP